MRMGEQVERRDTPGICGVVTALKRGKAQVHWDNSHVHTWNWMDSLKPAQQVTGEASNCHSAAKNG